MTWIVWAILGAIATGVSAILSKAGLQKVDSTLGFAVQSVIIVLMTWLIVGLSGKATRLLDIEVRAWGFLLAGGVVTTIAYLCYFRALSLGDAARVSPLDNLSLVFSVVFAAVLLGEKVNATAIAGVALMACGAVLVAIAGGSK